MHLNTTLGSRKNMTEASASVCLILVTALVVLSRQKSCFTVFRAVKKSWKGRLCWSCISYFAFGYNQGFTGRCRLFVLRVSEIRKPSPWVNKMRIKGRRETEIVKLSVQYVLYEKILHFAFSFFKYFAFLKEFRPWNYDLHTDTFRAH